MNSITAAQMRKIHVLSRERGIDNDTLHAHVFSLTKKNSIKALSIMEAVKVIDSLQGDAKTAHNMMTGKQRNFIYGLLRDIGWTKDDGAADDERLLAFIRERFHIEQPEWLTSQKASQVIEALKAMKLRQMAEIV